MADTFKGTIQLSLGWKWQDSAGAVRDDSSLKFSEDIADGNDSYEAEAVWHREVVTLLDAASDTYDLTNLTRTILGDTHYTNFLTVKELLIVNHSTTGGLIVVGNAAANEWSEPFGADGDTIKIPRNSPHLFSSHQCGWEVDDSNKNLKLLASGGDLTYSIAIIGTLTIATGDCSSSGL